MDRQGNDQSGGLSVNAAVFVPRNYAPPIGTAPIQGLPTYMTNCFPFVQPDFTGNRPSGNYGNWPRNSRPRFGNRNPSGFHGNRPPAPSKFPQSPIFPFTSPPPPPPNSFFNPFIPPPNNVFIGNLTSLPVMPSEADFNVGINQVESVEINTNNNNFTFNKRQRRKQKDKNSNDKIGRSNENINSQKENNSQRQRKRTNSGRKGGNTPRSTVLILCERELQTDFPESFSNKTLVQYPSPLYKSSSHIHNTKHDHDSDSGYSSPLHRKNQVCNGTQSETIQPWVMTPNTIQSDDPSIVHAASVPQQKFSYAFIAQKEPSPKPVIHVDNQKSAHQETHRQKSSNRNTVNQENSNFKSRKDKFSGNRSHGLTDNKQTKVNTHGSNNPQINSKIGFNDKLQGELQSKQYQMRKPGQKHLSDLDETKKGVNSNQNLAHQNDSDYGFSRTKNLNIEKHGEWRGKNESNLLKNISRSDKTNQFERQNQNGDDAGDPGKKKRKRRRRRKKKSKDGEPEDGDSNEEEELVPKPEVELHFEDVEEFPDLSSAKASENSSSGVGLSYSAILQTVPVRRPVFTEHIKTSSSEESPRKDNSDVKGTRASRRRRKRKDILNKEAENELAEIGLEQQMLKDQCLKTTKSTKDDKGQVPGILKVNPKNQPSGKKSKQNVSLDLGAVIDALEQKKTTISLTSVPRKEPKQKPDVLKKKETQKSKGSHNVLDSNAPVKRGKERETPKTKKPSPLKKVILKEREEKKHLRMLEGPESVATEAPVGIGVVSAESDLSQDAMSTKSSVDYTGTPGSANLSPISQTSPISMSPLSPGTSPLSSEVNSPIAGAVGKDVIRKIHSRRFREYCNQVLDKDIDDCATVLLQDLVRFQDRMYHKDPSKAKLKRRIVLGLREVTKHLKLKKIKCVIISPNLEKIQSKGGLDDALNNILHLCNEQNVPFVFALGRRALGRACAKLVPVSVAGIFNYSGSEENFRRLINLTEKARESYGEMVDAIEKEIKEYPTKIQPPTIPHVFAHMGHSRTPSGASVLSFTSSILSEPISENYPHSEPETDSKGYEIVKDDELLKQGLPTDSSGYHTQMRIIHSNTKCNVDDGNEADNEEEGVKINKNSFRTSEENLSMDSSDMVSALPHIDSIHSSTYDLNNEILSQHSGRTLENCEAMSTHSSRTIGDGSSTLLADMAGERSKHGTPKSTESPSNTLQRGMVVDEERIQNWVDETSSRLENLGLDEESYEDSTDDMSSDDESIESDDRDFEILKKDFKKRDSFTAFNDSQGSSRVTIVEHCDKMKSGANCDGKSTENADCSTEGANLKAQDCESKSKSNIKDETAGSRSTLKNENQSLISNCNSYEKPEGAEKRAAGQEKTPTEETNSYLTNLLTNIDCDTNNKICDTKSDNPCETDPEHVEIHID